MFAGIAMCFTAITPSIDTLNYPSFLFITPMSLFSGTFFPLESLPEALRGLAILAGKRGNGAVAPASGMAIKIEDGDGFDRGTWAASIEALRQAGFTPAVLQCKEGLDLVNGTSVMTALAGLSVHEAAAALATLALAGCAKKEEAVEAKRYDDAIELVVRTRQASISMVQRHLRIGYNRAARIIEKMEREGVVGPSDGVKPREVLVSSFERQDPASNKARGSKLDAGSKGN